MMRLAVTLGDPAGVGPEIILRLFAEGNWPEDAVPFVVGEARHLRDAHDWLDQANVALPDIKINVVDAPPHENQAGIIPVLEPGDFVFEGPLVRGRVQAGCGAAAWAYIRSAVALVQNKQAEAVVTGPIHKEALKAAGCPFPGHTEMLADLAGGARVAMLLVGGGVRVALATIHESIRRVPDLLSVDGILQDLRLLDSFVPWFGLDQKPRIAVCGLNPHSGEGGMFGAEEETIIVPAIARAREEGIDAVGPLPADTLFHFHVQGDYDCALAMYHDQGLIPVKTLDFHGGVNVTMGLPFIRTSVDHGTAFNITGQGMARPDSLRSALECAATLARNRR